MAFKCYQCGKEIVFSPMHVGKNGKKIPLDPATELPHDCPMRGQGEQKRTVMVPEEDRGNEDVDRRSFDEVAKTLGVGLEDKKEKGGIDFQKLAEQADDLRGKYVDHTQPAKPQLKLKTITDPTAEGMDLKYNKLAAEHNVKFSQYHPLGSLYTIAVYYEEVAKQ